MRCPYCSELENKVIDSRMAKEGDTVRRRRQCLACNTRFTTYERVERLPLVLIKKDNRREPFNREKILKGMQRACQKRDISINTLELFIDNLERELQELGEKEIPASMVGERVMRKLQELDDVAYVRFASVYREFKDINDFMSELKDLFVSRRTSPSDNNKD